MQRFAKEVKKDLSEISGEALGKLSAYDWPGNVRELANVIERAVVLVRAEIAPHDLPARIVAAQSEFSQTVFRIATLWMLIGDSWS